MTTKLALNETAIIKRFFRDLGHSNQRVSAKEILGVGDDAAILQIDSTANVVSVDTSTQGIHFPVVADAEDIGWRCLAVALSDLAAMGAEPIWFTVSLSLPTEIAKDETWLNGFSKGLRSCATETNTRLIGGDLVAGNLSQSVTVGGVLPDCVLGQKSMRRNGAQVGDTIGICGPVGGAREWLMSGNPELKEYFWRPRPQFAESRILRDKAHAAIDISDGLVIDAERVAKDSGLQMQINLENLLLADECIDVRNAAIGGDDYVLLFTASEADYETIESDMRTQGLRCAAIGSCRKGEGLSIPGHSVEDLKSQSWSHF